MIQLAELMSRHPVVPFVRESQTKSVREPWRIPQRRLLDYLLVHVEQGFCQFIVDETAYEFEAGEFGLVQPGSVCELIGLTETNTPFAHFDIFYNPDRESSFPTRPGQIDLTPYRKLMQPRISELYGIPIPVKLKPSRPAKFRDQLLRMADRWPRRDPLSEIRAQNAATELIIALLEDHADRGRQNREGSPSLGWIPSFFSFNLAEPLSIEDMASRAHLSPSRFSAVFREQYGMSPHRYLLNMRIEHAKELLIRTELTQEDIAAYCGFANVHHFSKTFRLSADMPPGEWRRTRS